MLSINQMEQQPEYLTNLRAKLLFILWKHKQTVVFVYFKLYSGIIKFNHFHTAIHNNDIYKYTELEQFTVKLFYDVTLQSHYYISHESPIE